MFTKNEGKLDRIGRVIVGALLILGFFLSRDAAYGWLYLIGLVPFVTGLIGTCPIYSIFGVSTCKIEND